MSVYQEWFIESSVWLWPRLADHLWQTTLFGIVVFAASFALRRGPARWRHTFWLLASAKFVIPIALFVFFAQYAGIDSLSPFRATPETEQNAVIVQGLTEPVSSITLIDESTTGTTLKPEKVIYSTLSAIWLSGTVAILFVWGVRRRRFTSSLKDVRQARGGREWEALKRAQEALQIKNNVSLMISPFEIEPAVWRAWRPIVVLPKTLGAHLDDSELEAIMLHELVHIRRRDNLIGNFQLALCSLLWFHPLVWFISHKLFDEREQACDETVMETCKVPGAYVSGILKVVRLCVGWRVAGVTGAASGSNLRRRIENIMSFEKRKYTSVTSARLLAGLLVGTALLVLVAAGLYSRPPVVMAATEEIGTVTTAATLVGENDSSLIAGKDGIKKAKKNTRVPPPPPPPHIISPPPLPPPPPPRTVKQDKSAPKTDKQHSAKKDKVVHGELIEAPPPIYPDEAKKQKIDGRVTVSIVIDEQGKVVSAKASSGPDALYGAAREAAYKARFKPTTVNGKPAKVAGAMTYNFVLDKK